MARDYGSSANNRIVNTAAALTATPLTLAAWVSKASSSAAVRSAIVLHDKDSASNRNLFQLRIGTGETAEASVASGTGITTATSVGTLTTDVWAHIAATFPADNARSVWLNGTETAGATTSRVPAGIDWTGLGVNLSSTSTYGHALTGRMCEAAIWNVGLTAQEIGALAKGYSPLLIRPNAIIAYWPQWGRSASIEGDWFGGFPGTIEGTVAQYPHPRQLYARTGWSRRLGVTAAPPGGLGIPIAAYHYNHHLGSMQS